MQVSIVIPIYNALPLAKQCVQSIYENGAEVTFDVILVDNGSAPDVEEWGVGQAREHDNLRYFRYPEPLGFAKSVNTGVAASVAEVVIVLNSDTIVTPGWMDDLYKALIEDAGLGALTPATNHAGEPAQMDFGTVDLPVAKALAYVAKRPKTDNILYLPQRVTFFCVALRRDVWLKLNGLDETFKVGNFEDEDLCLRLRVVGYRLGVALGTFVYHHNNATFTANKISHSGWMSKNVAVFAEHAREYSEAEPGSTRLQAPKRSGYDISVVILPAEDGSLDRTLRSLANQTMVDFEVIRPGESLTPSRAWVAYVTQGDILYPYHLEALLDALERAGSEAIFADGWVLGAESVQPHPDASRLIRQAPLMLSGWMHHASISPERLYDETVPLHWPRLTWEMREAPSKPTTPLVEDKLDVSFVERLRNAYRRAIPLETRHRIDGKIRSMLGKSVPKPDQKPMEQLAAHLKALTAAGADAGKFAVDTALPAVVMFNAISWNSVIQRQQHFARGLAECGHPVFWVEPTLASPRNWWNSRALQQLAPNVHMLRLPAPARDIYTMEWNEGVLEAMAAAVRQTMQAYGVRDVVTLINYPRWQPLAQRLRDKFGQKIASDCLDDQRALAGMYSTTIFSYEDWLVENADLCLTSSVVLQEKLHARSSTLLHNACDFDLFSQAPSMGYLAHLPHPIVGFFGALADWIDMDLIRAAAENFPAWTFVYIGPHTFSNAAVEAEWLAKTNLPNIIVLAQMGLRELASHLADFDVCTMPFRDMLVTHSMNPVKVYEYLAGGKPVVARDLPEVRHLADVEAPGLIRLYKTPQQFFSCLESALAEDNGDVRARRKAFAHLNDWDHRVAELSALLKSLVRE
jgi:GT2 family glycosyltransferase/glycosyltransferase involved in cell wall biosynthesis